MRWRDFFLQTSKDAPKDAATAAHRLLVRAGFVRQHGPGVFSHLLGGQRVVAKIRRIIREELSRAGLLEWGLSAQCADERAADFAGAQVKSYKQLPLGVFAFQHAVQDPVVARRTLLRGRSALVCEMHGFHADDESLVDRHRQLQSACGRIFERVGLNCVLADDLGDIGDTSAVAFMVPVQSGSERIARCADGQYAATLDAATAAAPDVWPEGALAELVEVHTPDAGRVEDVCGQLGTVPRQLIKTLIYTSVPDGEAETSRRSRVVALVRGDHDVNERKLCHVTGLTLELADPETILEITGARVGFAGPIGLVERVDRMIIDRDVAVMRNAATGANKSDYHITGVNPGRDFPLEHENVTVADIRGIVAGDVAPGPSRCPLELVAASRAGGVAALGPGLAERLQATYLDHDGKTRLIALESGRLDLDQMLALIVERHHDDDGILWPSAVAPFEVVVLAIDPRDAEVMRVAEQSHDELVAAGVDVLLDDRDDRAGSKFKDADLIGIPLRVIVGKRALAAGGVEFATRDSRDKQPMSSEDAVAEVVRRVHAAASQ